MRASIEAIEGAGGRVLGTADSRRAGAQGQPRGLRARRGRRLVSGGTPAGSAVPISIEGAKPVKRVLLADPPRARRSPPRPCPTVLSILQGGGRRGAGPGRGGRQAPHPGARSRPATACACGPGGEDLILVLGGDGSILRALAREAGSGAPVIGVNFGRVGFLASIERETLERDLRRALAGQFLVLGLPSLKAEWSDGEVQAVNDLALFRGGESRIADLTYAVDGELVATVRCDGLVCSTPVGSTAYNLAAGGPTVSWRVRCFVISFIALHHLDSRPLVIGAEEQLHGHQQRPGGRLRHPGRRPADRGAAPGRSVTVGLGGSEVHLATFPRGLVLPALPGEVRPAVIRSLEVRDLVVIEHAELAPPGGLTAITGETGRGEDRPGAGPGAARRRARRDARGGAPRARHAPGPGHPGRAGGVLGPPRGRRPGAGAARARRRRERGGARPPRSGRGPRPGPDRRPGRAPGGRRGARAPGPGAVLGPARAPPAGEPGEPALGARRLRRTGRGHERRAPVVAAPPAQRPDRALTAARARRDAAEARAGRPGGAGGGG